MIEISYSSIERSYRDVYLLRMAFCFSLKMNLPFDDKCLSYWPCSIERCRRQSMPLTRKRKNLIRRTDETPVPMTVLHSTARRNVLFHLKINWDCDDWEDEDGGDGNDSVVGRERDGIVRARCKTQRWQQCCSVLWHYKNNKNQSAWATERPFTIIAKEL